MHGWCWDSLFVGILDICTIGVRTYTVGRHSFGLLFFYYFFLCFFCHRWSVCIALEFYGSLGVHYNPFAGAFSLWRCAPKYFNRYHMTQMISNQWLNLSNTVSFQRVELQGFSGCVDNRIHYQHLRVWWHCDVGCLAWTTQMPASSSATPPKIASQFTFLQPFDLTFNTHLN